MKVLTVASTKGGVGKTTVTANLGGLLADAGFKVLMIDLDGQPTLSSYYALTQRSLAGSFELVSQRQTAHASVISVTNVSRLDLIVSNDPLGQLNTLLLHAPDGRLRLVNLLHAFADHYDLMLIDTQGARSVVVEMAVLASDLVLSPIPPEMLAARELHRGTLALLTSLSAFEALGVSAPPVRLVLNQVDPARRDTQMIIQSLRDDFAADDRVALCRAMLLDRVAYVNAASLGVPVHRIDPRPPPSGQPSALQSMWLLAAELFPDWRSQLGAAFSTATPPLSL